MKEEMLLLQEQDSIDEELQVVQMRRRFRKNRNLLHIENHVYNQNGYEDTIYKNQE